MIRVNSEISLPSNEIHIQFTRSSKPGGQNVNKVNTRATISFNVIESKHLSEEIKQRFLNKYSNRISSNGFVQVSCQEYRSQRRNLETCFDKLATMLRNATRKDKVRRKTKPSRRAKEKRIQDKKRRGETKKLRKKIY